MVFQNRNLYHLRVNKHTVLPLYLYLDEKHVDWMTRRTLNEIIADLKPLIGPKLVKESHIGASGLSASAAKKAGQSVVEVHRGENYQFAYFLKPAESYDLLIKARDFVAVTAPPDPFDLPGDKSPTPEVPSHRVAKNKRKRGPKTKSRPKASRAIRKRKRLDSDEEDVEMSETWSDLDEEIPLSDDDETETVPSGTAPTRRSTRLKGAPRVHDVDEEMRDGNLDAPLNAQDQPVPVIKSEPDDTAGLENLLTISADDEVTAAPLSQSPRPPSDTLVAEQEEEKPKQELQLSYTGYMIPSRCLCVIAEPWPALPTPAQLASQATKSRPKQTAPPSSSHPLFRPESDDEDEVPGARAQRRSPTLGFDSDDEEARLRMFSQMINNVGERRSGVAARGAMDEFEDDALYGDADEEGRGV
ncbi:hypothetical protein RSOLAG1IB_05575 [Rhizoctonia solani AG-1 IB]|uniref:Uncharacterized protein n=1 Tax=Thanatephorus cucumeris (strain AG1-IB / isolate 7/3/14) TaxID=1108050 RepID=A0A0B7G0Q2_THACB|nr:hypothetical protein RSOLAG1IB_05575 [Rhizoctonia solani AG-1 IB]